MVSLDVLLQVLFFVTYVESSEILRLRGVAISKLVLYDASRDFTCFDGKLTVPFRYVNDDYCDCKDGSDEPGTSACPNGWFHCTNAGHQPLNIPSSRVNDGICDCCDGSDEYATGNCSDYCNILGEEARVAAQKRSELIKSGCELRELMSWKGKKTKEKKKERLAALELDKNEADAIKTEKEEIKQRAEQAESAIMEAYRLLDEAKKAEEDERKKKDEEQEAFEAFSLIDSNNDEKIQINELKVRQTFDQNKDGVVSEDEIKFIMGELSELSWDEFLKTGWPRMKPLIMVEKGIFLPPSTEQPPTEESHEEEKHETESPQVNEEQEEEWDEGEEGDEETDGEEHLEEDSEDNKEKLDGEEEKEDDDKPKYDEESQKIIDEANRARSEFESAEKAVRDVEREIRQLQETLNKDFGHEDEFAPLDGECFEYTDREYVYKLCPFDQVSQRPKSGGAETRLGSWKSWVGQENIYSTMLYDRGQSCWNGPQRSAHVEVFCGLENAVTFAAEPNRCEYVLHFTSPSACWPEVQQETHPHDEL